MDTGVKLEAEVQGLPYDEAAWKLVIEQAQNIGEKMARHFEGHAGYSAMGAADKLQRAMKEIAHINKYQTFLDYYDLDDEGEPLP